MNSPIEAAYSARRTRQGDCRGRQIVVAPLRQGRANRAGFTLIEMLVSLAITLIMMGAVVTLFGTISASVSNSRSIIEISERLRATRNRLQTDLQGATATMKPPLRPENDEGYFEYIEGPLVDASYLVASPPPFTAPIPKEYLQTAYGDVDDVLMFTVRSRGEPFVGKYNGVTVESQVAEVMYFCAGAVNAAGQRVDGTLYIDPSTGNQARTLTLYRRVLLVAPGLNGATFPTSSPTFYDDNDISVHLGTPLPALVPNTLGDLTKREHRYAHLGVVYPPTPPYSYDVAAQAPSGHPLTDTAAPYIRGALAPLPGLRLGDDVLLTNVLSFDVQVYDPGAPMDVTTSTALTPTDPGVRPATSVIGAYTNLGTSYSNSTPTTPSFNLAARNTITPLTPVTPLGPVGTSNVTYDTWSMHYENNGIDDDGDTPLIDEGTDGLDNDTNPANPGYGIVDDAGEFETQPPFAAQLRGIRVTIRVYEPSSQQIRQVTVVGDFLPD